MRVLFLDDNKHPVSKYECFAQYENGRSDKRPYKTKFFFSTRVSKHDFIVTTQLKIIDIFLPAFRTQGSQQWSALLEQPGSSLDFALKFDRLIFPPLPLLFVEVKRPKGAIAITLAALVLGPAAEAKANPRGRGGNLITTTYAQRERERGEQVERERRRRMFVRLNDSSRAFSR